MIPNLAVGGPSAVLKQPELDVNRPPVAIAALAVGAQSINDVSGLLNPELASNCAEHQAVRAIMHTAARPKVRLQDPAVSVDAGPDFPKTLDQTIELRRRLDVLRALGAVTGRTSRGRGAATAAAIAFLAARHCAGVRAARLIAL